MKQARMTKAELLAWKKRWEWVNKFEKEELRRTPPEVSLRQLATLMFSVREFGWEKALAEAEEDVRKRWILLKERYAVRK